MPQPLSWRFIESTYVSEELEPDLSEPELLDEPDFDAFDWVDAPEPRLEDPAEARLDRPAEPPLLEPELLLAPLPVEPDDLVALPPLPEPADLRALPPVELDDLPVLPPPDEPDDLAALPPLRPLELDDRLDVPPPLDAPVETLLAAEVRPPAAFFEPLEPALRPELEPLAEDVAAPRDDEPPPVDRARSEALDESPLRDALFVEAVRAEAVLPAALRDPARDAPAVFLV